ncbi:unnamed protein product [Prorocentrum cordatum]|uniref:Uncharacterized protein n=1 Tax=Prorocentrum cordatum TaxID=2364126 RepID=A0ABN9WFT7_9DINO|nr:unnamed protein product [Polarella glacialis]
MFGVRAAGTCRVADLPQPVGEHPSRPFDSPGRQEPAAVGPHSWHSESAGSCLPGAPWGWGEAGGSRSTSSRASTALRGRTPTCGGSEAPGRARARVPRRCRGASGWGRAVGLCIYPGWGLRHAWRQFAGAQGAGSSGRGELSGLLPLPSTSLVSARLLLEPPSASSRPRP